MDAESDIRSPGTGRRGSFSSAVTTNSSTSVPSTVRAMSTEDLMAVDNKFKKKPLKKQTTVVDSGVFHKAGSGAYYFPNGEVFRPRTSTTPRKHHRHKPHSGHPSSRVPPVTSTGVYPGKRANSLGAAVPRSQSVTNLRAGQQKKEAREALTHSIRASKGDTPTNIHVGEFTPVRSASLSGDIAPPSGSVNGSGRYAGPAASPLSRYGSHSSANLAAWSGTMRFQSHNILRDAATPVTYPASAASSHSDIPAVPNVRQLGSLSEQNLTSWSFAHSNHSSSSTPQTSISTTAETVNDTPHTSTSTMADHKEAFESSAYGAVPAVFSTSTTAAVATPVGAKSAAQSSRDGTPEAANTASQSYTHLTPTPVNMGASRTSSVYEDSSDDRSNEQSCASASSQRSASPVFSSLAHFDRECSSGTGYDSDDPLASARQVSLPDPSPVPPPVPEKADAPVAPNATPTTVYASPAGSPPSHEDALNASDASDHHEAATASAPTIHQTTATPAQTPPIGSSTDVDREVFSTPAETAPSSSSDRSPDLSPARQFRFEPHSPSRMSPPGALPGAQAEAQSHPENHQSEQSTSSSQSLSSQKPSPNVLPDQPDRYAPGVAPEGMTPSMQYSPAHKPEIDQSETDMKETMIKGEDKINENNQVDPIKEKNFFDFHKNDSFNRLLNDDQHEVPPRGDIRFVDNKIRKHERSASSISSFSSIVNEESHKSPRKGGKRNSHSQHKDTGGDDITQQQDSMRAGYAHSDEDKVFGSGVEIEAWKSDLSNMVTSGVEEDDFSDGGHSVSEPSEPETTTAASTAAPSAAGKTSAMASSVPDLRSPLATPRNAYADYDDVYSQRTVATLKTVQTGQTTQTAQTAQTKSAAAASSPSVSNTKDLLRALKAQKQTGGSPGTSMPPSPAKSTVSRGAPSRTSRESGRSRMVKSPTMTGIKGMWKKMFDNGVKGMEQKDTEAKTEPLTTSKPAKPQQRNRSGSMVSFMTRRNSAIIESEPLTPRQSTAESVSSTVAKDASSKAAKGFQSRYNQRSFSITNLRALVKGNSSKDELSSSKPRDTQGKTSSVFGKRLRPSASKSSLNIFVGRSGQGHHSTTVLGRDQTEPSKPQSKAINDDKDKETLNEETAENEKNGLNLEKLPSIEQDNDMFNDFLDTFEETFENMGKNPSKMYSKSINELFLHDDELTKDQIKDQQIRDNQAQDEDNYSSDDNRPSVEEETILGYPEPNLSDSEDDYMDENIRYLRNEFVIPFDILPEPHVDIASDNGDISKTLDPRLNGVSLKRLNDSSVETIRISNKQLNNLFHDSNDVDKSQLPIHLKHIGQFSDYGAVEVSVRKFEPYVVDDGAIFADDLESNITSIIKSSGKHNRTPKKNVQFSNKISINETFSPDSYKRYNKSVTQYTLTGASEINKIKNELNLFKCKEMLVHEKSQNNTHFFY
ncbi:Piso0_002145 [Millerozyma farinosa CBS 7064]|uniref:Piso0_002145 protein n=1 Tax=Pichia sorbitophila (strain ATCC MYA-4447 / BCRC 22081 / CBS 7064 / NBRC 10061 / NRRL Y-12695) TaxID=559304 RepID=G8YBT8_PICSO|nr:Piso0_002145 [Millerozyma farinosa CBS 7064]